jgi:tetratricopeptide (TPR) repeat protein
MSGPSCCSAAQELDPLAHRVDLVTTLLRAGRYDLAVLRGEEAVEFDSGQARARATLGWAYFLSGKQAAGLAELERAVSVSPGNTLWLGQLGQAYAMAGQASRAREILGELEERAQGAYVSPTISPTSSPVLATPTRQWTGWSGRWRNVVVRPTVSGVPSCLPLFMRIPDFRHCSGR